VFNKEDNMLKRKWNSIKKWRIREKQLKEERDQIKAFAKACHRSNSQPVRKSIGFTGLFIKGQWDYEKELALSPSGSEYAKKKLRNMKLSCGKL